MTARQDLAWLRRRPESAETATTLRIVDLFAGIGGISLGLTEAGRRMGVYVSPVLAVDLDRTAARLYEQNVGGRTVVGDVRRMFPGKLGSQVSWREERVKAWCGDVDILAGGPPCQGHSSLNNRTRGLDERNHLYEVMGRAAEVLLPKVVLIENVPSVRWDISGSTDATRRHLESLGYHVDSAVLDASSLGVPQTRKRHVLIASRSEAVSPTTVLTALAARTSIRRTLKWAIGDLVSIKAVHELDKPARISADNRRRIKYLSDNGVVDLPNEERPPCHRDTPTHSYKSMYGRLAWEKAAQTITSGFGSMGQGRYVHPSLDRTLTPHEAARIQTIPDWFDWADTPRTALATLIGNAVPPMLVAAIGREIMAPLLRPPKPRRRSPAPSSSEAALRLRTVRRSGTSAEEALSLELTAIGLSPQRNVGVDGIPRSRPDFVFSRSRVAVFVDGCFWHSCPLHGTKPRANADWWNAKIAGNRERDRRVDRALEAAGWRAIRVWEHAQPRRAARLISRLVRAREGASVSSV